MLDQLSAWQSGILRWSGESPPRAGAHWQGLALARLAGGEQLWPRSYSDGALSVRRRMRSPGDSGVVSPALPNGLEMGLSLPCMLRWGERGRVAGALARRGWVCSRQALSSAANRGLSMRQYCCGSQRACRVSHPFVQVDMQHSELSSA